MNLLLLLLLHLLIVFLLLTSIISIYSQESDELALLRLGAGRYGSFAQAFNLPRAIDTTNISASYEGGVLRVVLPKLAPTYRRHNPYERRAPSFLDVDDAWW